MGRRGCRENLRRGKTRWESEKVLVSIGKRNTFLVHQHGVSLPGLYMIYIQILIQIICDGSIGEGKAREERGGGGGGGGGGEGEGEAKEKEKKDKEKEKEKYQVQMFSTLVQCHWFSQWTKCWGHLRSCNSLLLTANSIDVVRSGINLKRKVGHNLACITLLNVGPGLWPSHGCARGVEEHHLTTQPHQSILLLLMSGKLNGLLSNPLQPNICKSMFLSLFHRLRSHHNLHLWHRIHHVSHHILPSSLPPHDSNCLLCDIIKYLVLIIIIIVYITLLPLSLSFPFRSTHLHLFSPPNRPTRSHMSWSTRWMPSKVSRSLISLPLPSLAFFPYPSPSIHPPHANTSAAIQDGRITNCSWRLWGARETKGLLLSYVLSLPPFVHS